MSTLFKGVCTSAVVPFTRGGLCLCVSSGSGGLFRLVSHDSNRKTVVFRPTEDLAQDQVNSDGSLRIGQGNLFRGQENKEMLFPTTITFFPTPRDVTVVKEEGEWKGEVGVKGGVFKKSQRDFQKDEDFDLCFRLVLSESQIKSWFSSETGHRKKMVLNRVIEKGFTGLSQSIQDNEEGGHDQNEGVVEEGGPPPPTPPTPPPPPHPPPRNLIS